MWTMAKMLVLRPSRVPVLIAISEYDPAFSHFATCLDGITQAPRITSVIFLGRLLDFGLLLEAISSTAELFENLLGSYYDSVRVG